MDRGQILYVIALRYGEQKVNVDAVHKRFIFEFWANFRRRTYTVLLTRTNGKSCIVSSGIVYPDTFPLTKHAGFK